MDKTLKMYHETLSLELLGQSNLNTEELFLKSILIYDIADNQLLSTGIQIYRGPDNTLFSLLVTSNRAAFLELKVSF
jgi:hypothetical protein